MYPDGDFKAAADRLMMFLEQYWGGPNNYSEQRGHPRLRARHAPFHIASKERDARIKNMKSAIAELDVDAELKSELWEYLEMAANSLVNQPD